MPEQDEALPAVPVLCDFTVPPPPAEPGRVAASLGLVLAGVAVGFGLPAFADALLLGYVGVFVVTATPDSGFNVYTLGIIGCLLVAVVLMAGAFASLFSRRVRALGIGYLCGLSIGVAVVAATVAWLL